MPVLSQQQQSQQALKDLGNTNQGYQPDGGFVKQQSFSQQSNNTSNNHTNGGPAVDVLSYAGGQVSSSSLIHQPSGSLAGGSVRASMDDPLLCPEYNDEIIAHLLFRELNHSRSTHYLTQQPEITDRMRTILVDWLVDVAIKFKIHSETFFLAVDIVDRFLTQQTVKRTQLQLVGVTAILLAAKMEEIWPPEVKECIYISANTYTREDLLHMEREITAALNFRLTVPTCYPILCHMTSCLGFSDEERHAAMFYMEAAQLDGKSMQLLPSRVAYACIFLARLHIANAHSRPCVGLWDASCTHLSRNVTFEELAPAATQILNYTANLCASNSKYQAIRRKFTSSKYGGVANLPFPSAATN